jgi:hypothetical protein
MKKSLLFFCFLTTKRLILEEKKISGHDGGELVFDESEGQRRFGVEHQLGVGVIHRGSHHHQVLVNYGSKSEARCLKNGP